MDEIDRKNIDNGEILELEYELLESSESRRPKRLLVKEEKSKKADSEFITGMVLERFTNNYFRVKIDDEFVSTTKDSAENNDDKEECTCPLSGRFKNVDFDNVRSLVVVGDIVNVDVSSTPIIEEIHKRNNELKRYVMRGNVETEVVLAANIDRVVITASLKNPSLSLNLVDRYLCAAEMDNVIPIICINKIDLAENDDVLEGEQDIHSKIQYYLDCGIDVILTSAVTGKGVDELKKLLMGRKTVFSGHSGVGKSALINKLEPTINLKTGSISYYSNKGQHVTSNSVMVEWSFGGYLIDTPGIKTFGLSSTAKESIPRVFPGFRKYAERCKYSSCRHLVEDGCQVLQAVVEGIIPEESYQSYVNIIQSL